MLAPERDCRAVLAQISSYLDGELAATDCAAVERHCTECERCARLLEGLRGTIGLCREAADTPLPEAVRERARQRVRQLLQGK